MWRPVVGHEDYYEVSSLGRVRNARGYVLSQFVFNKYGHLRVHLSRPTKPSSVHRVVALAFHPNPENKPFACHHDGDPTNNRASNVYWGTGADNAADRERHRWVRSA